MCACCVCPPLPHAALGAPDYTKWKKHHFPVGSFANPRTEAPAPVCVPVAGHRLGLAGPSSARCSMHVIHTLTLVADRCGAACTLFRRVASSASVPAAPTPASGQARGRGAQTVRSIIGRATFVMGDKAVGAPLAVQLVPPLCTFQPTWTVIRAVC